MPKLKRKSVWISDVHLGFKDCKAEYLLDFLSQLECESLYLVGDIVDLWALKKRPFWPSSHYEVIKTIYQKAITGTKVIYIPGNHDIPMRDFDGELFGPIEIAYERIHTTADGKRLLMFHGDILDTSIRLSWLNRIIGDVAYDFLLFLNRWANFFRKSFGFSYWSLAYYLKNRVKGAQQAITDFENAAIYEARRRGLDGVICGHIHQAEILQRDGILYCNDGDWVESCTALTEDENGKLEILHWSEQQQAVKTLELAPQQKVA